VQLDAQQRTTRARVVGERVAGRRRAGVGDAPDGAQGAVGAALGDALRVAVGVDDLVARAGRLEGAGGEHAVPPAAVSCAPNSRLGTNALSSERSAKSSVDELCVRSTPYAGRKRPTRAASAPPVHAT
jgi:hypothetical protein